MMHRPWAPGTIDEWLPRSLRLCWGGDGGGGFGGDGGGGGFTGDSGFSGGFTGGGDWGSSGSFDASGFNAGGDLGAWAGTAYDASTFGSGAGAGGDWGSFGPTSYGGLDAPNPTFADIAGPNPGVTTGGGDWGSAGVYSAAGMGGGLGGSLFGSTGGGGDFYGDSISGPGGGLFGDYGGGGGGGGGYTGGGGGRGGGGPFGGGGSGGGGGRGAASPSVSSPYADDTGPSGRGESEVSSPYADDTGPTGRGEQDTVGPAPEAAPEAPSDFGKPAEAAPDAEAPPSDAAPSRSDDAPSRSDDAPSRAGSDEGRSTFGPESLNEGMQALSGLTQTALSPADVSHAYQEGTQALSNLTQSSLSPGPPDYEGSPYADMGPGAQPGRDFNQAFEAFNAQPGWDPGEQTAGRTGLAEPTDWAGSPYAPSSDVSVGRDFNQTFADLGPSQAYIDAMQALSGLTQTALDTGSPDYQGSPYADMGPQTAPTTAPDFNQAFESFNTPTGMDLAGDLATPEGNINPSSSFAMGWAPANAYEGRGADYASGRAAQDYVTSLVEGAPLGAAAPGVLSAISAMTGISVPSLLGGATTTGGILGGLFNAPTTTQPQSPQQQVTNVELVPAEPAPPATTQEAQPEAQPQEAQPAEAQPAEAQPEAQPQAQPEAQPAQPQAAPGEEQPGEQQGQPSAFIPGGRETNFEYGSQTQAPPPSLLEMAQPGATRSESFIPGGRATDFNYNPSSTPPQAPPGTLPPADQPLGQQPEGRDAERDAEHDDAADPHANTPANGRPLGAPTTRTQNTPVVSRNVIQEQQGSTRNRPVSEALHGILSAAAERAGVTVRVGSGGQIATRAPGDRGRQGGWTGSVRHNHGNAADVRLEQNGRVLNYNNPQDRVVMETFVREAARLGATGMGAGMTYMGPNTIHVGFGAPAFWRADNPGSRSLQQAYYEGRQGPTNRPPADIPNVRTVQPAPSSPSDFGPQTRGSQNAYAAARAPQIAEIRASPELQDRIATIINGEVGGKSVASKAAILEELLGRAAARGQTLFKATDPATRGAGYYQGGSKGTFSRGQGSIAGELPALLDRVGAGSNHSNFSTGNASGKTGVGQLNVKLEGEKHGLEADSRDRAFIAGIKAGTLPGARGIGSDRSNVAWADAVSPTQQIATPSPPAEVPAALPPPEAPLPPDVPVTRPPADIPAPAPAPFMSPPARGQLDRAVQTQNALNLIKQSTEKLTTQSGQAEFNAAGVVAAKGLAAAGVPLAMARSLMTDSAYKGAEKVGYGPSSMGWGLYKGHIDSGIAAALQGYQPARPGEVQGPYGFQPDAPTVAARAEGGPVRKDQPYLVGEEGPEYFVPDQPGTVWPHMPQPGKPGNIDRWPKVPAPEYPGRYGGLEREIRRQTRAAQDIRPSLMDMIDSGRLRLNAANWHAMLNDPALIALGRSRMDDRREGLDPGAEQYGAFIPAPEPAAAEPPDPTSPMAQALGYGSIRRPMRIGRQSY